MQKTIHLFEENIYLLSNHSVALNPMFRTVEMQDFFIVKMRLYLEPLCKVLAYNLKDNAFQLLLKLKDRDAFEKHYAEKNPRKLKEDGEIPETTYIMSQAMANMQVSFVKHFNFIEKRSGTLMAGRFERKLIESEEELMEWRDKLNRGEKPIWYESEWRNVKGEAAYARTSEWMYSSENEGDDKLLGFYEKIENYDLGGYWKKQKKYRLDASKSFLKYHLNRLFHQNGKARF